MIDSALKSWQQRERVKVLRLVLSVERRGTTYEWVDAIYSAGRPAVSGHSQDARPTDVTMDI